MMAALGDCSIDCSSGKPAPIDIAAAILDVAISAFSVDGVDVVGLVKELITEIVCCALQRGVSAAVSAANPARVIGLLRKRCLEFLVEKKDLPAAALVSNTAAGYGTRTPVSSSSSTTQPVSSRTDRRRPPTTSRVNWWPLRIASAVTAVGVYVVLRRRR
jgi:hypothetical protein